MLPVIALVFSLAGTALALPLLKACRVLDAPNERSNHKTPVPRGGGIAMILSALLFLWAAGMPVLVVGAALLLALVSFIDDVKGFSVRGRFFVQIVAVAVAVHFLPGRILPAFIPFQVETVLVVILWLWFINLTNFMDGIDGITSMQTILVMAGFIALRIAVHELPHLQMVYAAIIGAATLGFFCFNRPPAKLFMGDAGSIPLGFLMGYMLLSLAADGYWMAALILPAYYLCDATVTIMRRLLRREKIWQAHSQHAYQQAVRGGLTHGQVVLRIASLNTVLVILALLSTLNPLTGIALLILAYLMTLNFMRRLSPASAPAHRPAAPR